MDNPSLNRLRVFTTKELVNELSKRIGIERIDIAPHIEKVAITIIKNNIYYQYPIEEGPMIILKIID